MSTTDEIKRLLTLISLFAASFVVPVCIGLYFFGDFSSPLPLDADPVFPESLPVKSRGAFFSVDNHQRLNPAPDADFLLFAWFKLDVLPEEDREMSLLSKIDYSNPFKPGYALVIGRRSSFIRPSIYWKNSQGKGGTYEFSDLPISLGDWYAFVVSYKQPNILGLHLVKIRDKEKPFTTLLGAYELKIPVYPSTTAPLRVGAPQLGSFRGAIGPLGILSYAGVSERVKPLLKNLAKDPLSPEEVLDSDSIVFLTTNGLVDRGPLKLPIRLSSKVG